MRKRRVYRAVLKMDNGQEWVRHFQTPEAADSWARKWAHPEPYWGPGDYQGTKAVSATIQASEPVEWFKEPREVVGL